MIKNKNNILLKKDTNKFWSFSDTTNHKEMILSSKDKVIKEFVFRRSFLLEIKNESTQKKYFVLPLSFISTAWPKGYYIGFSEDINISFTDEDIINVIN